MGITIAAAPCCDLIPNNVGSQGVTWIVMNEPNFMSKRQLDEYRRAVALFPGSKVREAAVV